MNIVKSFECMNACITNHMKQAGIDISGSDIFFGGGGYPITYKKGSLTHISSKGYEANFRFLDECGISYRFGRVYPTKEALLERLQEPYTVTVRMVSDFLTYDRVFSQTSGASHFINVLKYSKEKRQFFIVDGDIPSAKTSCFSGWVDEEDIICGWKEQRGEILQLDLTAHLQKTESRKWVRERANKNVRQGLELYLKGKKKVLSGQVTGEKAICCMIQQLGKYVERQEFNLLVVDANFRLHVNGFLGMKNFLLEKLNEQSSPLIGEYESVVNDWLRWCMLLLKSGIVNTAENFYKVTARMEEIVNRERNVLEKLTGEYIDE